MSDLWTPIAPAVSCTATVAGQMLISASSSINFAAGIARIVNTNTTLAFCAMVSANATAGDLVNASPVLGNTTFFVMFGVKTPILFVSGASSVFGQAGYGLKG